MRQWLAVLALLTASCALGLASDRGSNDKDAKMPEQLPKLLQGAERADIPCKVRIYKPVLMFQQQYLVVVRGLFPSRIVESGGVRHLHLLLKVQDERGNWLEGGDYEDFEIPPDLLGHEVEYLAGVYVRPGTHRIGIAVYDSVLGKANVYHRTVHAPLVKRDPMPELDALLPEAEFPGRFPKSGELWPLSTKLKRIKVANSEPARLDVVVNVSKVSQWGGFYLYNLTRELQTASVLGRLQLAKGCVRVSVIDSMRMNVVVDRKNADEVDWSKLQEQVEGLDQNTIDIKVLENQKKVARFTHDFFQTLANDSGGCGKASESLSPYIAVVSHDFVFPDGAKIPKVSDIEGSQFFYLHQGLGGGWMDAMGQILNSAKTENIRSLSPEESRRAIARIISRIAGSGSNAADTPRSPGKP
jgi:hypothetical protein